MKRLAAIALLSALFAFFVANAFLLDRASLAFVRSASPRDTLSGLPEPRFFSDPDGYAWLCHARDMLRAGDWRIRHTHMDNAPHGRPMHWSHLLLWELAAHARLLQRLHPDMLLSPALEIAGRCAMPFFFLLFAIPLSAVAFRRLGAIPAALFVVSCAVFPYFAILFSPLLPDHHVFQFFFPFATFLCLSFGGWGRISTAPSAPPAGIWFRLPALPPERTARRWFFAAGVFHAMLLWIGATVWLVVHAAICLAALSALAPDDDASRRAPRLWLSFALSSIPLSVAFYLLEYAPRFPGMRLEVNHPLYWLFLAGSLLALMALSALLPPRNRNRNPSPRPSRFSLRPSLATLLCAALLALPLPAALLFGPASWHALRDPFLQRLHARYIMEFVPYLRIAADSPLDPLLCFRLFIPLALAAAFFAFRRHAPASPAPFLLRPAAVLVAFFTALLCIQNRWGTPLCAALLLPLLFLPPLLVCRRSPLSSPLLRRVAAAFLVLFAADAAWCAATSAIDNLRAAENRYTPPHWVECDLAKRAALRLASAAASAPDGDSWILAGSAPNAPVFYYFGGLPSLASFYWENAPGWHAEAPLLSDPSPSASNALAIARSRGLTHLVVHENSDFPELYSFVASPASNPLLARRDSLLGRLSRRLPPPHGFALEPALTEYVSRTNLYALPDGCFAPKRLSWSVYTVSP